MFNSCNVLGSIVVVGACFFLLKSSTDSFASDGTGKVVVVNESTVLYPREGDPIYTDINKMIGIGPCYRLFVTGNERGNYMEVEARINKKNKLFLVKKDKISFGWNTKFCDSPESAYGGYSDEYLPDRALERNIGPIGPGEPDRILHATPKYGTLEDALKRAKERQKSQNK